MILKGQGEWHVVCAFGRMIHNYLSVAFRRLARNKTYLVLNVAGLAVGIGACLLIFLVIRFELTLRAEKHRTRLDADNNISDRCQDSAQNIAEEEA